MTSYTGSCWESWRLDDAAKFEVSVAQLLVIGEMDYRLVNKQDLPKIWILLFARYPEELASVQAVRSEALMLLDRFKECPDCFDKLWTIVWLKRLTSASDNLVLKAVRAIRDIVSVVACTSVRSEKKHLLAQESKPAKRGKAVRPGTLSKIMYRKSVQAIHAKCRRAAYADEIGDAKSVRRRFGQCLRFFQNKSKRLKPIGGGDPAAVVRQDQRALKHMKKVALAKPTTTRRGARSVDSFKRLEWNSEAAGNGTFSEKTAALMAKWHGMSKEEKSHYGSVASVEDEVADGVRAKNGGFIEKTGDGSEHTVSTTNLQGGQQTKRTATRAAVLRSMERMLDHPIFTAGAGVSDFETGLRPDYVNVENTDLQMKAESDALFGYDDVAVENPAGPMRAFRVCKQKHGGLCTKDPYVQPAANLTTNTYVRFKAFKKDCPLLVEYKSVSAESEGVLLFLLKFIGEGDLVMFCRAMLDTNGGMYLPSGLPNKVVPQYQDGEPVIVESHVFLFGTVGTRCG